jgi:adenylate cyclase
MGNFFLKKYKKPVFIFCFALILAAILSFVGALNPLKELEYKTIDFRFRAHPTEEKADKDILLVAIDDYSLQEFSNNGISWPWPHDFYQIFVQFAAQSGAKNILFDILFYEPDLDRPEFMPGQTDKLFAEAMKESGNVILAAELTNNEAQQKISLDKFSIQSKMKENIDVFLSAVPPIPELLEASAAIGVVNVQPDSDGIIRRVPYLYNYKAHFLPQMALAAVLQNRKLNEISIPKNNEHFVYWYGKSAFLYVPFYAVIQSVFAEDMGSKPLLENDVFKDKIVIVGSTASGTIRDVISTPYPKAIPGMELWATVISNFDQNHEVTFMGKGWIFLLLLILISISYFIFCRFHRFRQQLLFLLIPVLYFFIMDLSWNYGSIWLPVVSPFIAFSLTFVFLILLSYFSEGKAKIEIQKIFSRYLHPDVINELIQHPDTVKLGGKEINATILFTDIANFTTFSEGRKAPELIRYLNEYFDHLTAFVLEHKGLLDKYTGDGIMAIFGAPLTREDNALLACRAALAHKRFTEQLTDEEVTSFLHQNTRLGINTGMIVAGNLGSALRMDYTAIGDDVNLAARLEGVNKIYKTRIMISDNTYRSIQKKLLCRELDTITVKGKHNTTTVYELLDERMPESNKKYPWLDDFNEGISFYKEGEWQKALNLFKRTLAIIPNDYATKLFYERCEKLLANPPADWNFVLNLETK